MKNQPIITIDLHGQDQMGAMKIIDQTLSSAGPSVYHIRVIHGFNRGTNLKNMIKREYKYHSDIQRIAPGDNLGETLLILQEL